MSKRFLYQLGWLIVAMALPIALFLQLRLHAAADPVYATPPGHF